MPRASSEVITDIAEEEINKLTNKSVVSVWEGTNDTPKNASRDDLDHITNCLKNSSHIQIFL
jgi:hypothetical protein